MISDKDRIFFVGLMLSASPVAAVEEFEMEAEKVREMRRRLQAPKCNDCKGAPDLTGDFHMGSWVGDEREVRALKCMVLSTLQELSGAMHRVLEKEVTDAPVNETFYRILFTLGEDFAEEDLLQVACGLDDLCAQVAVCGSEADADSRNWEIRGCVYQRHLKVNHLLHRVQGRFFQAAMWAEIVIAAFIFAAVIFQVVNLRIYLPKDAHSQFVEFIQIALDILTCLELITMLCRHDMDSIIEVMISAVTKNLLVSHESSVNMLLGVIALAMLFGIRKYLLLSANEVEAHKQHLDFIQQDRDD